MREAGRWLVGQRVDNGNISWEATLCSRSMGAEEWRIIMTWALRPGTRSPFKAVELSNLHMSITSILKSPTLICVNEALIMDHKSVLVFSKLVGPNVYVTAYAIQ